VDHENKGVHNNIYIFPAEKYNNTSVKVMIQNRYNMEDIK